MAARSIDTARGRVPRAHPVAGSAAHARRHLLRHRLIVFGPSTAHVVRCAGGWLCDRAMAGWDVTVLVADHGDIRPLQILGATVGDLEAGLSSPVRGPVPHSVAVDTELYETDERVRAGVRTLLDSGAVDVRLWGDHWPADVAPRLAPVQHHLSLAAKAFKAQALAATTTLADPAAPDPLSPTEQFRCRTLLVQSA